MEYDRIPPDEFELCMSDIFRYVHESRIRNINHLDTFLATDYDTYHPEDVRTLREMVLRDPRGATLMGC